MSISAFFDESGKFQSQPVISFAGVASPRKQCDDFVDHWDRCLERTGLTVLTMKTATQFKKPLCDKTPALGVESRVEALLPYVECIRKHMMFVSGVCVKVSAFKGSSESVRAIWGDDPIYFAFTRAVLEILDYAKDAPITLHCDEDEGTVINMYQLYRRIKQVNQRAREQLKAISFADDEFVPALQASDLVVSLFRSEARRRFHSDLFPHEALFNALSVQPDDSDGIKILSSAFVDEEMMAKISSETRRTSPKTVPA